MIITIINFLIHNLVYYFCNQKKTNVYLYFNNLLYF